MADDSLIFLNVNQIESGEAGGQRFSPDYIDACRFLHCSIIDRTGTIAPGFAYSALDPMPETRFVRQSFGDLCDEIGGELVAEALATSKRISLLWSGGIDSTAALIAIMKAATRHGCLDCLRVLLSVDSVREYPDFYLEFICDRIVHAPVLRPISAGLDPADLNVTGEHGDQLFGSHILDSYVRRGLAGAPWRDILPFVIRERLGSWRPVRQVQRLLDPVIASAPVRIRTLFDYFWWLNFSLKWQEVSLRLPAFRGDDALGVYQSLRHFYRDERFQQWAMASTPGTNLGHWSRYKDASKQYILAFTNDRFYFERKEKQDSLRNVMASRSAHGKMLVFMRRNFVPVTTTVDWEEPPEGSVIRRLLLSR